MELYLSFLLTSYDNFLGNIGLILRCFISLSTSGCGDHLMESGQSQNSMILLQLLLKKALRSFNNKVGMDKLTCQRFVW